jgi:hypothetical protein
MCYLIIKQLLLQVVHREGNEPMSIYNTLWPTILELILRLRVFTLDHKKVCENLDMLLLRVSSISSSLTSLGHP